MTNNRIAQKIIKSNSPVILLFGEEEYPLNNTFDSLLEHYCPDENSRYNLDILDANETDVFRIVDLCKQIPMMSEKRVVVIKNFDKLNYTGNSKDYKTCDFYKYLSNPAQETVLILLGAPPKLKGTGSKKASRDKIINSKHFPFNIILDQYEYAEFPKVYDNKIPNWIIDEFAAKSYKIDIETATILSMMVNPNLREISNEVDKIITHFLDKKEITKEDIYATTGGSRSFNVFELQKMVGKKEKELSLKIANELVSVHKQGVLIIKILSGFFISLLMTKELLKKGSSKGEIAKTLGKPIFFIDDFTNAAKIFTEEQIVKSIDELYLADKKIKSTSINPELLIQNLLICMLG